MWEDPIVAEIHRTREKLAAEFNYDVKAIFADLRKRQTALGARLVHPKKEPEQSLQPTAPVTSGSLGSESLETPPAVEL